MKDGSGVHRGRRRAGALAAAAAVAVLATACGSSAPSASSTASVTFPQEVALAKCMRSHGVPDFPDPSPSSGFRLSTTSNGAQGTVDIDSSAVQSAYGDCRHLLAGAGPDISQLQQDAQQEAQAQQKALPALLKFAQCMRGHGLVDFPDPTSSGLNLSGTGLSPKSPRFQSALSACQKTLPAGSQMHISVQGQKQTKP